MFETLHLTRQLYNAGLEQRREAYRKTGKTLSAYDQQKELTAIKAACPEFKGIYSHVLQDVFDRLDKSYKSFFSRVKKGAKKAGFSRFKPRQRWNSFKFKQCWNNAKDDWTTCGRPVDDGKRISIPKIGNVKITLHRPLEGKPKSLEIVLDVDLVYFQHMTRKSSLLTPEEVPAHLRHAYDFENQFLGKTGRTALLRTCITCGGVDEVPVWQIRAGIKLDALKGVCKKCWPKREKTGRKGAEAANWKGGKYLTPAGYVMLSLPVDGSGKSRYIQEHRAVMQQHLGRQLSKGETVHHKNGLKEDNRIENLELFSSAHARGQRYDQMRTEDLRRIISEIESVLRSRT